MLSFEGERRPTTTSVGNFNIITTYRQPMPRMVTKYQHQDTLTVGHWNNATAQ